MILAVLFANVEGNILIERYALKIGIVLARSILLNFCFIVFFNRSSSLGFIYIYIYIWLGGIWMDLCLIYLIFVQGFTFFFSVDGVIFFFGLFLCALFCVVVKWEIVNDWEHLVLGEYLCCLWWEWGNWFECRLNPWLFKENKHGKSYEPIMLMYS
jgi:hypothetical protein